MSDTESCHKKLEQLQLMHMSYGNSIEAGNCLVAIAADLPWPSPHQNLTSLVPFSKKENLLKAATKHFSDGRYWERGIEVMEELRDHIESASTEASALRKVIAAKVQGFNFLITSIASNIPKKERLFENYFFVDFHGNSTNPLEYPAGRKFVARAGETESLGNFISKLRTRWPTAEIVQSNSKPVIQPLTSSLAICVRACKPVKLPEAFAVQHDLPSGIWPSSATAAGHEESAKYQENVNVNVFLFSRPFKKGVPQSPRAGQPAPFSDLWICDTYVVTKVIFPTYFRWSEVAKMVEIEKSPLENACDSIEAKNTELSNVTERVSTKPVQADINHLSMNISGVVDAAVSGGIKHYITAFLTRDFITRNIDKRDLLEKLCDILMRQSTILANAIKLHKTVVDDKLIPFHQKLEKCYEIWKRDVESVCREALALLSVPATVASPRKLSEVRPSVSIKNVQAIVDRAAAGDTFDGTLDAPVQPASPTPGGLQRQLKTILMSEESGRIATAMETPRSARGRSLLLTPQSMPAAALQQKTPRPSDTGTRGPPRLAETPDGKAESASEDGPTPLGAGKKHKSSRRDKAARELRRRAREEQVLARIDEAVKAVHTEMSAQIESLQKANSEAAAKGAAETARLEKELGEARSELTQAKQSIDSERQASKKLADDLRLAMDQRRVLEARIEHLQIANSSRKEETAPQAEGDQRHASGLKSALAIMEAQNKSFEMQVQALGRVNTDLEKRARKAEAEVEEMERQCGRLEQYSQTVSEAALMSKRHDEGEIDRLSQENSYLRTKMQSVKDVEASFMQQLVTKDEEIQSMGDFVALLQEQLAAVKKDLEAARLSQEGGVAAAAAAAAVSSPTFAALEQRTARAAEALDLSSTTVTPRERSFTEYPSPRKQKPAWNATTSLAKPKHERSASSGVLSSTVVSHLRSGSDTGLPGQRPIGPAAAHGMVRSVKIVATTKARVVKRTPGTTVTPVAAAVAPRVGAPSSRSTPSLPVASHAKKAEKPAEDKHPVATATPDQKGEPHQSRVLAPTSLSLLRRTRATSSGTLPQATSQPLASAAPATTAKTKKGASSPSTSPSDSPPVTRKSESPLGKPKTATAPKPGTGTKPT